MWGDGGCPIGLHLKITRRNSQSPYWDSHGRIGAQRWLSAQRIKMSDDEAQLPAKEIAKVANNLINKISKAVGVLYSPTHTKRMAKADAKAKIIAAEAEEAAQDIAVRAEARRRYEQVRHQENIESVIRTAIPDMRADAKPEGMDDDWISDFFDHAKKVSDQEMQSLWAKILAGEANAPGSFRKRVLQTVSLLEKDECEMFSAVCRFCWNLGGLTPLILEVGDKPYKDAGLDFDKLTHLDTVGLIDFNSLSGYTRGDFPPKFNIAYGDQIFSVEMPEGTRRLPTGSVILTATGIQLLPLSNAKVIPGYENYVIEYMKKQNITLTKIEQG